MSHLKVVATVFGLCLLCSLLYVVVKQNTSVPSEQAPNSEEVESIPSRNTTEGSALVTGKHEEESRLLQDIQTQLSFGPRYSGMSGHTDVIEWITKELATSTWNVEKQEWVHTQHDGEEFSFVNIVSRFAPEKTNRIILGAHYDSRAHADQDKNYGDAPVPGANDSASGVAVLIEVVRRLAQAEVQPNVGVDVVFFDAEEGDPRLPTAGNPWRPYGSEYFAHHVTDFYGGNLPEAGLIVDMVCDANLEFIIEGTSHRDAKANTERVWSIGHAMYPELFSYGEFVNIYDDHISLNAVGIPSTLLIDFTYPYWHTTRDTIDKCSAKNMEKVVEVVLAYVYSF
ncbi:TPA: peptidase M28 [Patescibacteria group bacterium]|nr:MAG: hypothetical protein UU98_C0004G0025 [Parcubacteria group bacterium GW2011_GWD2_42_14]HCC05721.1 peptidase M28 [Patescibacteria group bacterium]